ncbi:MAG: CBS domain-containing protein [Desulfobacterales bacterium]|nr:CBS domain-containing protein [Desulfobacterales bacterium]
MEKPIIQTIIIPLDKDVLPQLSVHSDDKITDAIEAMLKSNLKRIAVSDGNRVVGMIELKDALKKVGI